MIPLQRNVWVLLLLLITACGDSPPPPLKILHEDSIVLAFGDSLTYGTGAPKDQSYPAELSRLLGGISIINAGVPGEVSQQGRARLPELLAQHQPQLVLLCHGGNDILRKQNRAALRENLQAMLQMIKQAGADAVLLGVPQPGLISLSVPELYPQLAEEFAIPYQGEVLADVLDENNLKSDPIHPNAAGYQHIAQALADLIKRAQNL